MSGQVQIRPGKSSLDAGTAKNRLDDTRPAAPVLITQLRDGKTVSLAEFKGAIREIEVYPGASAEWWFVPVASGKVTDLRCGISE
ncbi:MAG: hypothetical protein ABIL01_32210 [Pseudomonadota bacterium]